MVAEVDWTFVGDWQLYSFESCWLDKLLSAKTALSKVERYWSKSLKTILINKYQVEY